MTWTAGLPLVTKLVERLFPAGRHPPPSLEIWCQPTPGDRAWLVIRNLGGRAIIEATADVMSIKESVQNPLRQQTYTLAWRDGSRSRELSNGSRDSLLLAQARLSSVGSGFSPMPEMVLLEAAVNGEPRVVDQCRWHGGQDGPTIELEVTVTVRPPDGVLWKKGWKNVVPHPTHRLIEVRGHKNHAISAEIISR
jgi:hypothetical protein